MFQPKKFPQLLLHWYAKNKRDLPWRHTDDPYCIWVSEVMLQQTQVEIVIPYYQRFIASFPTVQSLARASQSEILKFWEGLGYYSRARNLHTAAAIIVQNHNAQFPRHEKTLRQLPGVGPYIAAAVMSIAFNDDIAVVDGNVVRVICRLYNIAQDPHTNRTRKLIKELAQSLLATGKASTYNQAIMELGALVCRRRNPDCGVCPVASLCLAYQEGDPESLPITAPKPPKPHYDIVVGLVWKDDELLIAKRPQHGLLGGLWELPGGKRQEGELLKETARREIREELGIDLVVESHFMTIKHAYTHFRITMYAYNCRHLFGTPQALGCDDWRWVKPEDLRKFAFPRANTKLLEKLLEERNLNNLISCQSVFRQP